MKIIKIDTCSDCPNSDMMFDVLTGEFLQGHCLLLHRELESEAIPKWCKLEDLPVDEGNRE